MTATKKPTDVPVDETSKAVQARFAEEQERGYVGIKVDPNPDEAYALTTGPDSPSHVNGPHEQVRQYVSVDDPGAKHELKEA